MKKTLIRIFELENARNMNVQDLVQTFVPTPTFYRLLSPKNHIILGSRGSGKTALAKMLSHNHLSQLRTKDAHHALVTNKLIGVFIPTTIEWVGALSNIPWPSEADERLEFTWQLNVSSCLAFLTTLKSCIEYYINEEIEQIQAELHLSTLISEKWFPGTPPVNSLKLVRYRLHDLMDSKRTENVERFLLNNDSVSHSGKYFYAPLFSPIKHVIMQANDFFNFQDGTIWMILIDEAEYLEEKHFKILNTCMRSDSREIVFKITTMPYKHKTLETLLNVSLNEGHDFEYIYIDEDPVPWTLNTSNPGYDFANSLFRKRAKINFPHEKLTLLKLLGDSILIGGEKRIKKEHAQALDLVAKYCTPSVVKYAQQLYSQDSHQYDNSIYRKLYSVLRLRDEIQKLKGRGELSIYSGYQMVLRCGDGNPRKMIRLYNLLLRNKTKTSLKADEFPLINFRHQNRLLTEFASSILEVLQSEQNFGSDLYKLINSIGGYFEAKFKDEKLSTNTYFSVDIDDAIEPSMWALIENAVDLGFLHPNINPKKPSRLQFKSGAFRLSYTLAPYFKLYPRRAEAVPLNSIINARPELKQFSLLTYLK